MLQIAYSSYSLPLNTINRQDESFTAAFSFLIVILGISAWYLWTIRKPMTPLPPGPRGLPVVGYLPFLGLDNLHLLFTDLAGAYGPIFKLWLGNKLTIVISSPSLVKQVVRDNDVAFSEREPSIAAQILATDVLSNANLKACYGLRREQMTKTIWDVYENVGKPFDIGELAFLTAISATVSMMWGSKLRGQEGAIVEGPFKDLSSEIMVLLGKPNISDIFPWIALFDVQGIERDMKKIRRSFNELLDSVIEPRMKAGTEKEKVDGVRHCGGWNQYYFNYDRMGNGRANTKSKNNGKVKKELGDVVGLKNTVEEFHLPNLSYLNAVIKETFRVHPPLPLLVPRSCGKSLHLGGYTIPKGSRVFLNIGSICMDPNIWDTPSEFRPERFLNDKFDFQGNDFRYFPFGSGRRRCPGLSLGEKMLSFILASLVHSFEWKLPHGTELDLSSKFGSVVKKKIPLRLIPMPRLTNLELYKE
ncbi:Copper amine oxidase family protein [Hibiscus syriacus]|uniref:Copper amine oxidase family protein n=1 Tax=Hibiscus syriacus TaxID=106335 RepID=A0A6A2XNF3_HIBSY|nr:Copper amine oxidase family protein [Hibiscus syriacus]